MASRVAWPAPGLALVLVILQCTYRGTVACTPSDLILLSFFAFVAARSCTYSVPVHHCIAPSTFTHFVMPVPPLLDKYSSIDCSSGNCYLRNLCHDRGGNFVFFGVELSVVFDLVSKGYGVCSVWVHGW